MDAETEKQMFLGIWDKEFQTTLKVIKAYPENRQDFKPHEIARSAKDIVNTFISEERVGINGVVTGNMGTPDMSNLPTNIKEAISIYEKDHKNNFNKIKNMRAEDLSKMMKFWVAPKKMGDVRKIDVLWGVVVMDMIHHRGQFSVYLRIVGGKVPSIYGPTADEKWM